MPTITTTEPERRQVARVLTFPATVAPYVDWARVAREADTLGADFDTRRGEDGGITVSIFWRQEP